MGRVIAAAVLNTHVCRQPLRTPQRPVCGRSVWMSSDGGDPQASSWRAWLVLSPLRMVMVARAYTPDHPEHGMLFGVSGAIAK